MFRKLQLISCLILLSWSAPHRLSAQYTPSEPPGSDMVYEWSVSDSHQFYVQIKKGMNLSRENQDSAIRIIKQGLAESERYGYHEAVFNGYFFLGVLYIYRGEYDVAYGWLWKALTHTDKSGRTYVNMCRALNNMGNIFQFRGNYRQALACYFKAIPFAEGSMAMDAGVADPLCRLYTSTASALLQLKEYSRALYYLNKAEALANEMHFARNLPAIYVNKAVVLARVGEDQKAWAYNQQALSVVTEIADEVRFMALQNQGDIMRKNGAYESAVTYLKAALKVKGNVNPYYKAGVFSSLGDCFFAMGDHARATEYFKSAYKMAEASGIPEHMLYVHQQLAYLYEQTNNYRQAYEHRHAAYILNDSLLNKDKMEAVNLLEVKYRTAESRNEVARKQLLINEQRRKLGQKNMWILITITGIAALTGLLAGFYRNYRQRQKLHSEQLRSMQQGKEIELLLAIMQGEEKERIRFAHELHDGISSQLSAMKLYLDTIRVRNPGSPVLAELDQVKRMLSETSDDVRKTAHNLMPDGLIRQGLGEAVRSFCGFISKGDQLRVEVETYGELNHLERNLALSAYRLIQELVHNIVKHAHATQAIVLLHNRGNILCITIEDNGKGMELQMPGAGGIGLKSQQDRVQAMGGYMIIESVPGKGTTICIELPVSRKEGFAGLQIPFSA